MSISSKASRCLRLGTVLALSCAICQTAYSQEHGHDFRERDFHGREFHGGGIPEHEFRAHEFREHEYHDPRFLDSRFHHNHYYPSIGFVFGALPPDYRIIYTPGGNLYFAAGVWYRPYGPGRYVVVAPAFGLTVPILPPAYTTVMVRGVPYYYANNTYYLQSPGGYTVANPPPASDVVELGPNPSAAQTAPPNGVIELPRN